MITVHHKGLGKISICMHGDSCVGTHWTFLAAGCIAARSTLTMQVIIEIDFFTPRGSGLLKDSFHFFAFSSRRETSGGEKSG